MVKTINGDKFLGQALKQCVLIIEFPKCGFWNIRFRLGLWLFYLGCLVSGMGVEIKNDRTA